MIEGLHMIPTCSAFWLQKGTMFSASEAVGLAECKRCTADGFHRREILGSSALLELPLNKKDQT